jgi:hypothetical protein
MGYIDSVHPLARDAMLKRVDSMAECAVIIAAFAPTGVLRAAPGPLPGAVTANRHIPE